MFRLLGLDRDLKRWLVVSRHASYQEARAAYALAKNERSHLWLAVAQVRIQVSDGQTGIVVLESDAPNPDYLPAVEAFRLAATAP